MTEDPNDEVPEDGASDDDTPRDGSDGGPSEERSGPDFHQDVPDADEIRGPLSASENGDGGAGVQEFRGIRSPGSNGHEPDETTGSTDVAAAGGDPDEQFFVEEQQFRQRWVWAMFGFLAVYAVVTVALNPVSPVVAAVILGLPAGGLALLYVARLRTEVRGDGIHVEFFPFHRSPRTIPYEDVVEHEAMEYDPVRDYYGWGIRRGLDGWAYNVAGNEGVKIDRTPDVDVLIGSQRPEELNEAIAEGLARSGRTIPHGGDQTPRWQAVAQFQDREDLEDVDLPGEDEEDDDEEPERWF